MAKITRATQKQFGRTAGAVGNFVVFGSLANLGVQFSKDPSAIQSLPAFELGWQGAVVGTKSPSFEDMNSLFLLAFRQLAYLMQQGIAEWDLATEYTTGSLCTVAGKTYISKQDLNLNHAVTDSNWWRSQDDEMYLQVMQRHYPVGEVYVTRRAGNPSSILGFGTWVRYGEGTMPIFQKDGTDFQTIDATGGSQRVSLTAAQNGPHDHVIPTGPLGSEGGNRDTPHETWNYGSRVTGVSGSGEPHENMPPYTVAWYSWLRTA